MVFRTFFLVTMLLIATLPYLSPFDADQSFLVNIENCFITAKHITSGSPCELFGHQRRAPFKDCPQTMGALLIPPPKRADQMPKILLLHHYPTVIYKFTVIDIPFNSSRAVDGALHLSDIRGVEFHHRVYYSSSLNQLVGFLYDYTNLHLYIFMRHGSRIICEIYLLIFDNYRVIYLYKMDVHSTFLDVLRWSSNPYRQMFYYQKELERDGEMITVLYAIPYYDLISSLKNGVEGVIVSRLLATNLSLQVNGNFIFADMFDGTPLFVSLDKNLKVQTCSKTYVTRNNFVTAISDWEFCKMRDGQLASKTNCEAQPIKDISIMGPIILRVKWLYVLIATFILFVMALVLVLLCIRCRILSSRGIRHNYSVSRFMTVKDNDSELMDNTL